MDTAAPVSADAPAPSPATLLAFAAANDAAMATSSKLKKQAILGDYFRALEDADLRLAVRYAAGRAFPATDARTLNVGGRHVSEALLALLRIDPGVYHDQVVRSGEIGEALTHLWPAGGFSAKPADPADEPLPPILLRDLDSAFAALAETGNVERKRAMLVELFARCAAGREATYAAKIMSGEMRTGLKEGILQAAVAHAFAVTLADVQRCQLLVGDLDEVAVLAKHTALATARFRLFHPIQCMLAAAVESPADAVAAADGRTLWAEDKLDGIRAQIHKSPAGVAIYTRDLARIDAAFPDVAAAAAALPGEFLLDGEIVPFRDGTVRPFAHIQKRLGRKAVSAKVLADNPAAFIAFDLLYRDETLLMDEPLRRRREELQALASGGPALLVSAATEVSTAEQVAAAFDASRGRRNEGIVLKDPAPPYSPGRRGQNWFKLKTHLPTFDCVVTAAETGHGKRRQWLSDYTFAV